MSLDRLATLRALAGPRLGRLKVRCRLHPHDGEDIVGAVHRRYTGVKCRWGTPSLGVCLRRPPALPPRAAAGSLPRARVLDVLQRGRLSTHKIARRAGLDLDTARDSLWRLARRGLVRKTAGWVSGKQATWEVCA